MSLPSVKTIKRVLRPAARSGAFVKTVTSSFPVQMAKSGARGGVEKYSSETHAPVMIVLPNEWAKKDISKRKVHELIRDTSRSQDSSQQSPCFLGIEDASYNYTSSAGIVYLPSGL